MARPIGEDASSLLKLRRPSYSTIIAVVSALASVGSLAVAWSALNAYPNQLKMTERMRVCIAFQGESSEFVSSVSNIESALTDGDIDAYRIASDRAIASDRRISQHISALSLLGPQNLTEAALRARGSAETFHDAVVVSEQRGDELSDEVRAYGLALRRVNDECTNALR